MAHRSVRVSKQLLRTARLGKRDEPLRLVVHRCALQLEDTPRLGVGFAYFDKNDTRTRVACIASASASASTGAC
jgi:hypothetical protein